MTVRTMRMNETPIQAQPVETVQPLDPSAIYRRLQKPAHNRISWKAAGPALIVVLAGAALVYGVVQSGHQAATTPPAAVATQSPTVQTPVATPAKPDAQAPDAQAKAAASPDQPAAAKPVTETPAATPRRHLAPRTVTHVARDADRADTAQAASPTAPTARDAGADASATVPNDAANPPAAVQPMAPNPMTASPNAAAAPTPASPPATAQAPVVPAPVNPAPATPAPAATPIQLPQP